MSYLDLSDFDINWGEIDWGNWVRREIDGGGYVATVEFDDDLGNGDMWAVHPFNPDETGGALIEELIPEVIAEWKLMREAGGSK